MTSQSIPDSIPPMADHILAQIKLHRARSGLTSDIPPLFVGVQGPQGSGKTYLTCLLKDILSQPPYELRTAVLSMDDLYLPYEGLVALAERYPENKLLQGRGQPGTHDLALGVRLLGELHEINHPLARSSEPRAVRLPVFDKSQHGGKGDRAPESEWPAATGPLDVVLLEGWLVGFAPLGPAELEARYDSPDPLTGLPLEIFDLRRFCRKEDVLQINELLWPYLAMWSKLEAFIYVGHHNQPS
jgi:D-glycerate 3-kinase